MPTPSKILPYQFETIPDDLVFTPGAVRGLTTSPTATPDRVRVSGAEASAGSNANGADSLLTGGDGDGTGKKGKARVEQTCLTLEKVVPAGLVPRGPNEIDLCCEDDAGDAEFFVDTPGGVVQVTKDGALNTFVTTPPATDTSISVEDFTQVSGGFPPPAQDDIGNFRSVAFPAGATTECRGQLNVGQDFRDGSGDQVTILLRYAVDAGANTVVRLQLYGQADNTALPNVQTNVTVGPVNTIQSTPVVYTIAPGDVLDLSSLAMIVRRVTFVGEYTGNFHLISIVAIYKSVVLEAISSVSSDLFTGTANPSPSPGVLGSFKTSDFPFGSVAEIATVFNVPKRYAAGSFAYLRLSFAMSTAGPGTRVDLSFEGSVNNVTAIPASAFSVYPTPTIGLIQLTVPLLFMPPTLAPNDEIAVKVKRLATDTYNGLFRLVSVILVFGSTVVSPGVVLEDNVPMTDSVPGVGPPDTDTFTDFGDVEVYRGAVGTANGQDMTFVARCRLPASANAVSFIRVVHKVSAAVGGNGVIFRVIKSDGSTIYTSALQTNAARTEFLIVGGSFSSQPAPGSRFLVTAQCFVDNSYVTYAGEMVVVGYE